ncbi:hypothetical protein [Streptomyces boluensis]|uniref:Uncharacterized protein n=1 Tax=Streptomyces boluensis TaxID=1775135 RepID=A0A964UP32_9ACTN|nr:hypothetical protein [Streptomyces boluensis]NBE51373.1 hypothetical protein [Streptomyces boluensis]
MPAVPPPGQPPMPPGVGAPLPGQAPWQPYPHQTPPGGGVGRKVFGGILCAAGALFMIVGLVIGGNAYSNHQQQMPNEAYGNDLWRNEPVEKLFPKTFAGVAGYGAKPYDPKRAVWHRVGISPKTDCEQGLTYKTLKAAKDNDCKAVLRATYVDPTANMVATLAVVVLPEGAPETGPKYQVAKAWQDNMYDDGAVSPYQVPGTIADKWPRNGAWMMAVPEETVPYAVGVTVGSVDGHVAGELPDEFEGGLDADRDSWSGNARNLVETFVSGHLSRVMGEAS